MFHYSLLSPLFCALSGRSRLVPLLRYHRPLACGSKKILICSLVLPASAAERALYSHRESEEWNAL
jgi:hypothetical protein